MISKISEKNTKKRTLEGRNQKEKKPFNGLLKNTKVKLKRKKV